jgi:hypothetical protein
MTLEHQGGMEHAGGYLAGTEFDVQVAVGRGFMSGAPPPRSNTPITTEEFILLGQMTQLQSWRQIPDRVSAKPFEFEVTAEALTEAGTVQISVNVACRTAESCRVAREAVKSLRKTTS